MYEEDVKNKLIVWFKKYGKYKWVITGERIGDWGIFPNYNPIISVKLKHFDRQET